MYWNCMSHGWVESHNKTSTCGSRCFSPDLYWTIWPLGSVWKNWIVHISWLRLLEAFWGHFWTFCVFWVSEAEIIDFWLHFFEKVIMFLRGSQAFPVINFRSPFPWRIPLLNFQLSDFWEKLNCPYLLIYSS